ncbi:MAG: hypothetical protein J6P61_10465 [Erysipelotrichaceae bacterium]|nr:hypothetical protein [Erysipelotrichaceae bacterium]
MDSIKKKYIYINLAIMLLVIMIHTIMPEAFCIQIICLSALALYDVYMNLFSSGVK